MPSIRYISSYYRMIKIEDLMKVRPNHSFPQKNGCSRNDHLGLGLLLLSTLSWEELCPALGSCLFPSTAAAGESKISAQEAEEGTRQLLKQWELAALAPFQLLHGMALPAFDKTKQTAEKWHLRQRMEKKEGRSFGPGPRRQLWCLRHSAEFSWLLTIPRPHARHVQPTSREPC